MLSLISLTEHICLNNDQSLICWELDIVEVDIGLGLVKDDLVELDL